MRSSGYLPIGPVISTKPAVTTPSCGQKWRPSCSCSLGTAALPGSAAGTTGSREPARDQRRCRTPCPVLKIRWLASGWGNTRSYV